jgi:hypothetical protein
MMAGTAFILAVGAADATAQETQKIGLTIGTPSSVGILWRVSDKLALRPDFSFSRVSDDDEGLSESLGGADSRSSGSSWQTGIGLSALLYLDSQAGLRTYFAPRLAYLRSSGSFSGIVSAFETTSSSYQASGSFGAEYELGARFGLFGEAGISYATLKSTSISDYSGLSVVGPELTSRSSGSTVSLRGGVGVIVFF